jgi:hypothetical protein
VFATRGEQLPEEGIRPLSAVFAAERVSQSQQQFQVTEAELRKAKIFGVTVGAQFPKGSSIHKENGMLPGIHLETPHLLHFHRAIT